MPHPDRGAARTVSPSFCRPPRSFSSAQGARPLTVALVLAGCALELVGGVDRG